MESRKLGNNGLEVSAIEQVPFSSLGKGYLIGNFTAETKFGDKDFRNILPHFTPEALEKTTGL